MMRRTWRAGEISSRSFQLVDIRHAPSKQDVTMRDYLRYYDLDGPVVSDEGGQDIGQSAGEAYQGHKADAENGSR